MKKKPSDGCIIKIGFLTITEELGILLHHHHHNNNNFRLFIVNSRFLQ
jgi:hypothetical protein